MLPPFLASLRIKAKAAKKRIVLPEAEDERIIKAASILAKNKILTPIIIGNENDVQRIAKKLRVSLQGVEVINPRDSSNFENIADRLYQLRKAKGMTPEQAKKQLLEPIYYGMMLVYLGKADGLVSGAAHSTAETLRPALQILKPVEGVNRASTYFLMVKNKDIRVFSDCALNENPDAQTLAETAVVTGDTAKKFGLVPRIAMLSSSTKGSGSSEDVKKVQEATRIAQKNRPDLLIDGELQLDAAFSKDVAKKKCPGSKVAGNANVFIFPDLDAGNIGYKLVEYFGAYLAIGPIVQGIPKPVSDLSRGCTVEEVVHVATILAVQAQ